MAREFAKSEIIRQKCSICGIKNKRFTELLYDGKMCGYRLTCCKCGHVDTFFNDTIYNHCAITDGREVCIQVTTCDNRGCKYYKKYSLKYAARLLDRILNGLETDCICDTDINCNDCEFNEFCPNKQNNDNEPNYNCNIENSDRYQLVINGYKNNNPKFH